MPYSNALRIPLFLVGLTGLLVGCGSLDDEGMANSDPTVPVATPVNGVYLLRHKPVAPDEPQMAALMSGTLIVEDGCLRVEPDYPGSSPLIIWPAGFEFQVAGDEISILDPDGYVVARVGEPVEMGGGLWAESGDVDGLRKLLSQQLDSPIPEHCAAPFWLVGYVTPSP